MNLDYPVAAILSSIAITFGLATLFGALLARVGFPLPTGARLGCTDGLRGYLALAVVAHHFIIWLQVTRLGGGWTRPSLAFFNNIGAGGVVLFFMTTGFVFYPVVLRGFRATSWAATFTTRVFRIVPLIMFSVAVISGVIWLRTGHGVDASFPKAAAFWITSWGEPPLLGYADSGRINAYVLWSLWFEWLFYLFVLPLCALGMDLTKGRLPSWALPSALLLVSLGVRLLFTPHGLLIYLPFFAVGMVAFECSRNQAIGRTLQSKWIAAPALASLVFGLNCPSPPFSFYQFVGYTFFFICIACGNDVFGALRTKSALVLGECSYGIYLLHGIILSILFDDGASAIGAIATAHIPVLLPLAAILVVSVAAITFLAIERPAIRLGRRIAKNGKQSPTNYGSTETAPAITQQT